MQNQKVMKILLDLSNLNLNMEDLGDDAVSIQAAIRKIYKEENIRVEDLHLHSERYLRVAGFGPISKQSFRNMLSGVTPFNLAALLCFLNYTGRSLYAVRITEVNPNIIS